jgi:hypothetical protein
MSMEGRLRWMLSLTLIGAMALAGCSKAQGSNTGGGGGTSTVTPLVRPRSTAELSILQPKNGQTVHGSSVELKVSLKGARIVPATTTHLAPDQGHLHVYIDNQDGRGFQIVSMTFGLDQRIPNVAPGQHVLRVEFVASDHLPFDPRVFSSVVFRVAG